MNRPYLSGTIRPPALCLIATLAAALGAHAGDILRGGSTAGARVPGAGRGAMMPPGALQARSNQRDALARTTQALQSVKNMQKAARQAAIYGPNNLGMDPNHPGQVLPNVINGLGPGGLMVSPAGAAGDPNFWRGANQPTQTVQHGHTTVTVEQTDQQALLTWQSFDIGKETTLHFDQSAGGDQKGQWIAFNIVNDPTGVPSQILGSITGDGQVYVINRNGIIFGGSSQINLHGFVASSLPINENLIDRGLLNNPDAQFLFSGLSIPAGTNGTPAFTPDLPFTPNGQYGDVTVQPGAVLRSPTSPDHVGGRIALIGPNVTNEGRIATPDGQTILAAGLQVGFAAHDSKDPTLRGLDVYIGAVADPALDPATNPPYAGTAINDGIIDVARGNATVAGKTVKQLGAINSSTSVALNGRIDLLAEYDSVSSGGVPNLPLFFRRQTGVVTLGDDSVTQILPELWSSETVVGLELALNSQINIRGHVIHLGGNSTILAPSADVDLSAGSWRLLNYDGPGSIAAINKFVLTDGQIYLDEGALINVAGSVGITAPITDNIVAAELRGAELADSPLQRLGPFYGTTIQVDIRQSGIYNGYQWIGTPLANASGYVGLIERTVGQLTTTGGNVKLNAGESVVMQTGSTVDVSGGWIDYQSGMVQTTRVVAGGRIIDISQATPDVFYEGVYTGQFTTSSPKYGVTETFSHPLALNGAHFEEGYVFGADGGTLAISAPAMALDGQLRGQTVSGPRQRTVAPTPGMLSLSFTAQEDSGPGFQPIAPTPPNIVFQSGVPQAPVGPFALDELGNPVALPPGRENRVYLSPDLLSEDGFGKLIVENGDGDITVPADVTLQTQPGGSIALSAANITILGDVIAPGGSLAFTVFGISPYEVRSGDSIPVVDPSRGHFTLGSSALLSTAGLIVDDRLGTEAPGTLPKFTSGGSITIKSFSTDLAAGSIIDVSGGIEIDPAGKRTYGNGGSISISAGQDPNIVASVGGHLTLDATLLGFAGARGGSLSILAPAVQVGGTTSTPDVLLLAPDFFNQGGFASFSISGIGIATGENQYLPGVYIAPGTVLEPHVQSVIAMPDAEGTGIVLTPMLAPVGLRTPVSLAFNAVGAFDAFTQTLVARGDLLMGEGALIQTDPLGSVTLKGNTVAVLGSVIVPGGSISITGASSTATIFPDQDPRVPLPTVDLGPTSYLSTAGTVVLTPDRRDFRSGIVLPGGSITVSGNIVAEAGAILDVSGTSGVLDLPYAYSGLTAPLNREIDGGSLAPLTGALNGSTSGSLVLATRIDSSGGSISFIGAQELFIDATLLGSAGGPTALGGSLNISSGHFIQPGGDPLTPLENISFLVTQGGSTIPGQFYQPGQTAIGHAVLGTDGTPLTGMGYFSADTFNGSGLDSLAIHGNVQFSGPVSITAGRQLSIADGGIMFGDAAVTLTAPYVAVGQPFQPPLDPNAVFSPFTFNNAPFFFSPEHGTGSLTVVANLIDIGTLSLQGFGAANFYAYHGDIRGQGTLNVAGDISLVAGQIYPPTAVSFTIAAFDYQVDGVDQLGSVTIASSGYRELPLSAGGQLNIYGSIINQGGILRAPIGEINIGWDGTGTAPVNAITGQGVAITQQLTLTSGSITSVSAVDPVTGEQLVIPFGLNLNGVSWIDPSGTDITVGGVPEKQVNLAAVNINDRHGAVIDMQGGGDLYAYQWVPGIGGSNDILASTTSFAIIPGYDTNYAPFAPFNPDTANTNLASNPGYVNATLGVGDRIYLDGTTGLAAGFYTLLPARYALLPGAFLVTPKSGAPVGTLALPDGSSLVSGYRVTEAGGNITGSPVMGRFEIASAEIVFSRAEYHDAFANSYLLQAAVQRGFDAPRLPADGGHLVLQATDSMILRGSVAAQSLIGNRGGLVDISSPVDIVIGGEGTVSQPGTLVLNASELSQFGAESLLIGGIRETGANNTTTVTVTTDNLTVDNAGSTLAAPDIILVANENVTLADNAQIAQSGRLSGGADTLIFGDSDTAGSGNGALLRISGDAHARIVRSGVTAADPNALTVGAGVQLTGTSLILDSTNSTTIDSAANLDSNTITVASGRMSIQLDNPGELQPTTGLVLTGGVLQDLQATQTLSLLSYSSIDVYGTGSFAAGGDLSLHAAEIRGFNNDGGTATFSAHSITLDNSANGTATGSAGGLDGTLAFNADTIRLGENDLHIDQFANLELNATNGIVSQQTGSLTAQGAITANTPVLTGARLSSYSISAGGALTIQAVAGEGGTPATGGLGASLTLEGASVTANGDVVLPSGELTLHATSGDVVVGGRLDVSGTAQSFYDLVRYTDGGQINLDADAGSVTLSEGSNVSVAGHADGGDAGGLAIRSPGGVFTSAGTIDGHAAGGRSGTFMLDAGSLPNGSVSTLAGIIDAGGFTRSVSIRDRNDALVLVDANITAHTFNLSADRGSITVSSTIDASGVKGGSINLRASGSVTVEDDAVLTVHADEFSNAGKGGSVSLEAGSQRDGVIDTSALLDIRDGSTIDLAVASNKANSAAFGNFTGTLHLRAPQTAGNTDLQINAIDGSILGASAIIVEGYSLFDLTASGGAITTAVQTNIRNNGTAFTGNTTTITERLLANNGGASGALSSVLFIEPGAEVINRNGDLTLGTSSSAPTADWNLATSRFGPKSLPGVLTLRASGDLVFFNTLSDGFVSSAYNSQLLTANAALPANVQSYSYRLAAGADFSAVDFHQVQSLSTLGTDKGSVLIGKNNGASTSQNPGQNATTSPIINPTAARSFFQVIRTGSGDIDIAAGRDVKLLNQFATVYTAGTRITNPADVPGGTFQLPAPDFAGGTPFLGASQQGTPYAVQYSLAGGDVSITAGADIVHQTRDAFGNLIDDSSRELPINWLYRAGFIDPATGKFGVVRLNRVASTTWWVDFSNFFTGVGALGGGDVTMIAGNDIRNVDASIPTNARMAGRDSAGNPLRPDPANMLELGGGDLVVQAGHDIDGGVYYVERGQGSLSAGNDIHTNSTRDSLAIPSTTSQTVGLPETWLPTTLFVGKSQFEVAARGDLLLGPVANPFLLPEGYSNSFFYKTYFSTYSPDSAVAVSSLGGTITFREGITTQSQGVGSTTPLIQAWLQNVMLFSPGGLSANAYQPWLRLNETNVDPFAKLVTIMPSTLQATAFSDDINIVGDLTLFPSPRGTLDLASAGSINALQPTGETTINGLPVTSWTASTINLSDANPALVPGITSPFAYRTVLANPTAAAANAVTGVAFLDFVDALFDETGSTQGPAAVLQTKQALHAPGLLHADDPNPIHLYATDGSISGLTLFSGKSARIIAGLDLTDIALYIQNVSEDDVSIIATGRDLIAYNPNSPLRALALSEGNALTIGNDTLAGDIQISGPGTLEILAGRNLDLGVGPNNADGTGLGITSIGNARNPYLGFDGASVIAGAGLGNSFGLASSQLDFPKFISEFLDPSAGENANRYLPELGKLLGVNGSNQQIFTAFSELAEERQAQLALDIFFLVLRDAGRDASATTPVASADGSSTSADGAAPAAPTGGYENGFAAIDTLFPGSSWDGDISLTSREIKTRSGGDITLFAPGGQLVVGFNVGEDQAVDQGILTEAGGNISIFTHESVVVGTSRIFTLRGGNELIWSSTGDIAAGASSKTVQSAPPTRVLVDPQSADVQTDLAGLATGGGIGVLATVKGVPPGDIDLIAPAGVVDAGDAGIRSSGNLNIAATQVLNASNIQTGGTSSGVPSTPTVSAPSIGSITTASNASGAATNAATNAAQQNRQQAAPQEELPSIISVEVVGYGGGEGPSATPSSNDEEEKRKKKEAEEAETTPSSAAPTPGN